MELLPVTWSLNLVDDSMGNSPGVGGVEVVWHILRFFVDLTLFMKLYLDTSIHSIRFTTILPIQLVVQKSQVS